MTSAVLAIALSLTGQSPQAYPAAQAPAKVAPAPVAPAKVAPAPQAPSKIAPAPVAPSKVAPAPQAPSKSPRLPMLRRRLPRLLRRLRMLRRRLPRHLRRLRMLRPRLPRHLRRPPYAPSKVAPAPSCSVQGRPGTSGGSDAPSKVAPAPQAAPYAPSKVAPAPQAAPSGSVQGRSGTSGGSEPRPRSPRLLRRPMLRPRSPRLPRRLRCSGQGRPGSPGVSCGSGQGGSGSPGGRSLRSGESCTPGLSNLSSMTRAWSSALPSRDQARIVSCPDSPGDASRRRTRRLFHFMAGAHCSTPCWRHQRSYSIRS